MTPSFMAKTHFFHYHLLLSSQINAMETFDYGFSSFTSPPLLLFHANSSDLVPNVLGSLFLGLHLYFWVWVFVCVWVCVSNVKGTFDKTHELRHHHRQCQHQWSLISILFLCSFFFFFFFLFWFGSLFVWVLVNLWIDFLT